MVANAREERGRVIAERCRIERKGHVWIVPSQSGNGKYTVRTDSLYPTCTCPDYETHANKCKHLFAVEYTIRREEHADGSVTEERTVTVTDKTTAERRTYTQDWPAYTKAQCREKDHFGELLSDLCATIPEPPRKSAKGGRPPVPLKDSAFLAIFKVYVGFSSRRFMCDMHDAYEAGYLAAPVGHASVIKAMESEALTPVLEELIGRSAAPLAQVESQFAVDSSGFCMARYHRWIDVKYGTPKEEHDWVKVHCLTGTKTHCVVSAEIHDRNTNDCNILPSLVETGAERFTLSEVSADKAYAANPNFDAVAGHGGTLYATFRKSATGGVGGLYRKMFHLFCADRDTYLQHYHRRSNVESVFSAVKRKFGEAIRSKSDVAAKNEVYAKLVCQNVCCLIQAMYELNLTPPTWRDDDRKPIALTANRPY
jgi:transposase